MTESRSIELSIEVPGSPEEVWETIATGPGITSWFTPMVVDERVGGDVVTDFGESGKDTATVTAWEPPHRVVFQGGGARPLAYEWLVEARSGGTCVVRLVNSGFGRGEEWDADFEGMSGGWKIFLENLRLQLTHFRGRRARTLIPTAMVAGPHDAAWSAFCDAMGIADDLVPGDRMATAGQGVPLLSGTVAKTMRSPKVTVYLLVIDGPAPGTAFVAAEGEGDRVACSVYLYLYGPEGEAVDDTWSPWLASRFEPVATPAPEPSGPVTSDAKQRS